MRILIDLFHYRQGNKLIKRSAAATNLPSFSFTSPASAFPFCSGGLSMHSALGWGLVKGITLEEIILKRS